MALVLQIVLIPGTKTVIMRIKYDTPIRAKIQIFLNDLMAGNDVNNDFLRVLRQNMVPTEISG